MKKIISAAVSSVILLSCFSVTAAATNENEDKLPFKLEAPTKLSLSWLNGQDSPTTMSFACSMNDSMCKWLSDLSEPTTHDATLEKLVKEKKLNDVYVNLQIDWAIDDQEKGWHYTKYWDGESFKNDEGKTEWAGLGHDRDYQPRFSEWDIVELGIYPKTVNEAWLFRGINVTNDPSKSEEENKADNPAFYGTDTFPGIKDQLKEDQYTLEEIDPETHEKMLKIDFTKHTAYVRARWAVTLVDMNDDRTPVFSEWSEVAGSGKDAAKFEPIKKEELLPPVISSLRYYPEEFNGYPQIACTLDVPEELSKRQAELAANGGAMRVYWEARVHGGKWIEQQAGADVTAGENVISLLFLGQYLDEQNKKNGEESDLVLEKDSPVELRARYWVDQYNGYQGEYIGEMYSDYSDVLTFGSQEMSKTPEESVKESSVEESSEKTESKPEVKEESVKESSVEESSEKTESKPEVKNETKPETKEKKCSLCGFCPQPLGLCIFIWIAILVAVVIVIVVIILVVKKKKSGDKEE